MNKATNLGFIIPLFSEAKHLLELLSNVDEEIVKGRKVYTGFLGKRECAVIISGCGKIKCASTTQLLIDKFPCDLYIHYGTAGGISPDLEIGNIVVAEEIIEHDVKELFPKPKPVPRHRISKSALGQIGSNKKFIRGKILSGDRDIVAKEKREKLYAKYKALSVDWESAGFVLICNLNRVPCLVFRIVSDFAHESTAQEYRENKEVVIKNFVSDLDVLLRERL